jgi:hypothetical protein
MKKFGHKLLGIALLCSLLPNYTDAQTAAESSSSAKIAAYMELNWSAEESFKIAQNNFETATGCAINIQSHSSTPHIMGVFVNTELPLSHGIEITIKLFWRWQGDGYAIDSTIVMTDKAQELFTDEALKAFKDSIQFYREETTTKEAVKVDEKIIAALETLQKGIKGDEPKKVLFSPSKNLHEKIHIPHFDDNSKEHCSAYPTYKENEPYIYVVTQSNLYTYVTPPNQVKNIVLTENTILSGDKNPFSCTFLPKENTTVIAYKKSDENKKPLGKIHVLYTPLATEIKLTICVVKYKTDTSYLNIRLDLIENYIQRIYGSIGLFFDISPSKIEIESPDVNSNGKLDVKERTILENLLLPHVNKKKNYTVFIINQYIAGAGALKGQQAGGYADLNHDGYKHPPDPKQCIIVVNGASPIETIPHEMGHAIFGLKHPFEDEDCKGHGMGKDPYNIMDYDKTEGKCQLRAYQVKKIR